MKKYLFIIFLIAAFSNTAFADDVWDTPMMDAQDVIFRSSLMEVVPDVNNERYSSYDEFSFDDNRQSFGDLNSDEMPFFKQMRLRANGVINSVREHDYTKEKVPFLTRIKFWDKKTQTESIEDITLGLDSDITNSIQSEVLSEMSDDVISLEGEVSEQVTEKQLLLDADNISFDEETGEMIANGRPVLNIPPQKMKVIADVMTYNDASNILKGIGDVIVLKDGMPIRASYLEVDMNEETAIMDDIWSKSQAMNMSAKNAVQRDGLLVLTNGSFYSEESQIHRMMSRMVGPRFYNMILDEDSQSLLFGDPSGNKILVDLDDLYVDARKNHDVIKAKGIRIYRDGKKVLKWPRLTVYTNKNRDYFEASYPEFGSRRKVGMFLGPGFVFGGPGSSVVKVIPFLNYNKKFGFGGALKYMNTFNRTELGYGSANEIFFLRGIQKLDDNLFLEYAANSYTREWFMGSRMAKYLAELYYDKSYVNKDFLAEGMNLTFRHRIGFGFMQDNDRNFYGEKIRSNDISTTRLRYMAGINQNFYSYKDPERRIAFAVGLSMQGSAAVYGTGDTQFIARVGPRVHFQYKNWMQDIGYFLTGYSDDTPLPRYDRYRYGHQSVYITEALRLNKYLSVGWAGNINLSDDAPNGKMFQENAFIVAFGPDDLKVSFGYDFVRKTTRFGFNLAFDTKGTNVTYKKMEIKNPERLGKNKKKEGERTLAFTTAASDKTEETQVSMKNSKSTPSKHKVLEYAQVINIEDPDKETVQ